MHVTARVMERTTTLITVPATARSRARTTPRTAALLMLRLASTSPLIRISGIHITSKHICGIASGDAELIALSDRPGPELDLVLRRKTSSSWTPERLGAKEAQGESSLYS